MCMIQKVSVEDNTGRINSIQIRSKKEGQENPNFKGAGAVVLAGIQACERMPMVNVAVIDMLSAILPRTIVESMTNWFAGFEAFRRESSGLIVNCLIPSVITLGIAKMLNPAFMPKVTGELNKRADMSRCWADKDLIQKASELYTGAKSQDKVRESMKTILSNMEGIEGNKSIMFKDVLGESILDEYSSKLAEISRKDISNREMRKEIKEISNKIIEKTRVAENVKVDKVSASSVNSMLEDSVKFFREYQRTGGKVSMEEFAKKSMKMVRTKSLLGLAVVLPLAASMQYINRWITGKLSGTKGAPIYDDFGKGENIEENPQAKEGLLKQKLISISSMVGVSLLSMMKLPTWKMLDFKGMFPTMDQARIISTFTFASRMAAADDKNELAEATVRDIATFSSLYFLGDYAAKGVATAIQKKTGVALLNDTKPIDKNASSLKKFWHWVKDVNIKSSEEVVSRTEQALKGALPTGEQYAKIQKELQHARNLRSACQVANIGVSLALLGLVIPIFTRRNTKKKHEEAKKLAQENAFSNTNEEKAKEVPIHPLNIKYSELTTGFRSNIKNKIA